MILKIVRAIISMMLKRVEDIDIGKILLDKKSYENIFIFDITFETSMSAKTLRITFNKVDGVIKNYAGTEYLELFVSRISNAIYR